jgi:hypothetical protein
MKLLDRERTFVRPTLFSGLASLSLLVICFTPGISLAAMDHLILGALVATVVTTAAHFASTVCYVASRRHNRPVALAPIVTEEYSRDVRSFFGRNLRKVHLAARDETKRDTSGFRFHIARQSCLLRLLSQLF